MNAKELKYLQSRKPHWNIKLPPVPTSMKNYERQIVYGTLLGDGSTQWRRERGMKSNEAFRDGPHCKGQEGLLIWEKMLLHRFNPVIGSYNNTFVLITSACPIFTIVGHNWYDRYKNGEYKLEPFGKNGRMKRIKILPENVLDYLGPLGLAKWYMDDGHYYSDSRCKSVHLTLAIDNFTIKEDHRIKDWFQDKWHIETTLQKTKDEQRKQLYITTEDTPKFLALVKPYVKQVPCMDYKLGIDNKNADITMF